MNRNNPIKWAGTCCMTFLEITGATVSVMWAIYELNGKKVPENAALWIAVILLAACICAVVEKMARDGTIFREPGKADQTDTLAELLADPEGMPMVEHRMIWADAIDIKTMIPGTENCAIHVQEALAERINAAPAVDRSKCLKTVYTEIKPTDMVMGYRVQDLMVLAQVLRGKGAHPEDLKSVTQAVEWAIEETKKEMDAAYLEGIKRAMGGGGAEK